MDRLLDERELIFDVSVISVTGRCEATTTAFRAPDGREFSIEGRAYWSEGHIGCLRLPGPIKRFGTFVVYPDQRLRRWPAKDKRPRGARGVRLHGWRLVGVHADPILVREGIVPGAEGNFVPDQRETLKVLVPLEFIQLCEGEGLSPQDALATFAAHVCNLQNVAAMPREDGLATSDPQHAALAQSYYRSVHGWPYAWIEQLAAQV